MIPYVCLYRMPISAVHRIRGVGDVMAGRVEQGVIKPGVNAKLYPSGCGEKYFQRNAS